MSWLSTLTRRFGSLSVTVIVLGLCLQTASGQSLESAISPGDVTRSHIKQEAECKLCHVRFDRSAQPRLCLSCHTRVAADVRTKSGYHGRLDERECRACHTEHKGREARIVTIDERLFDHSQTDFTLSGRHLQAKCAACHRPKVKHRDAPLNCAGCHSKDDKHKNTLGAKCERCHSESDWKQTRFDHTKTRFPLLLQHAKRKCVECHSDSQHLAETSRDCLSCHRKDDKHKGTLGAKCEQCHSEGNWKETRFDHANTRFPLLLRHMQTKCVECHADLQHFARTPLKCVACHAKDDVHKLGLGDKCESCHNEKAWKQALRFDHDRDSPFPLRDAHRKAKCETCHKDAGISSQKPNARRFSEKPPTSCFGCHARDDQAKGHRGRYGDKCQTCHIERSFGIISFDHGRDTRYALRGKHLPVKCDTCHTGSLYRDKLESQCYSCHVGDDRHSGQLGRDCAVCHGETRWQESSFDHGQSVFPLRDRHANLDCKKCHASAAFKDAKSECVSCHAKDDVHQQRLGPRCVQCHSARRWTEGSFDHDLRSRFKLTYKHAKTKCLSCHVKPVAAKVALPVDCINCHRQDDIHFETSGVQCERCHMPDSWRHLSGEAAAKKVKS